MNIYSTLMRRLLLPALIVATGIALAAGPGSAPIMKLVTENPHTPVAEERPEQPVTVAEKQIVERDRYLEAAAAAQRGDYVVAYCFWRPLAEQGDAEAQYALGWMYHNGYGLVVDDNAAREWWEKAIAQGHADAMFSLGTLYSVGSETVPRDYASAMTLWVQSASSGNENARFALWELSRRNLPELATLTSELRAQHPQFFPEIKKKRTMNTRLGK